MPHLNDYDLRQMDEAWQGAQPDSVLRELLKRALQDLRSARDRLNQTPANSSRPSGSMPPWKRGGRDGEGEGDGDGGSDESAYGARAGKHRRGQQPTDEAVPTDNAPGDWDLASQQGDAREGREGREG